MHLIGWCIGQVRAINVRKEWTFIETILMYEIYESCMRWCWAKSLPAGWEQRQTFSILCTAPPAINICIIMQQELGCHWQTIMININIISKPLFLHSVHLKSGRGLHLLRRNAICLALVYRSARKTDLCKISNSSHVESGISDFEHFTLT